MFHPDEAHYTLRQIPNSDHADSVSAGHGHPWSCQPVPVPPPCPPPLGGFTSPAGRLQGMPASRSVEKSLKATSTSSRSCRMRLTVAATSSLKNVRLGSVQVLGLGPLDQRDDRVADPLLVFRQHLAQPRLPLLRQHAEQMKLHVQLPLAAVAASASRGTGRGPSRRSFWHPSAAAPETAPTAPPRPARPPTWPAPCRTPASRHRATSGGQRVAASIRMVQSGSNCGK